MYSESLRLFFKSYPQIIYNKGDKILRPNEYSGHIYLVTSGTIRIFKILKSGQEITFSFYHPKKQKNLVFGYTHLLIDYHIEAFSDVILYRAPKTDFLQFSDQHPDVKDQMNQDMQIYFSEIIKQVEWLSIPDAYTRMKLFLHYLAERVGRTVDNKLILDNTNVEGKMTHQLIASFTGLSRETVTIQINRLIAEKYISRYQNTLAIEKLEELLESVE